VQLLWPHGLGLYRYAMLNAMFVRRDAADAAGLDDGKGREGEEGQASSGPQHWRPADEFECWRASCVGSDSLGNVFQATALGVHTHLLPTAWGHFKGNNSHLYPFNLFVPQPPQSADLPDPPRSIVPMVSN
ncbi:unnamed protein product, partial [Polarella glacialis]